LHYRAALIVFVCQEVIGLAVFPLLNHYLGPQGGKAWESKAILKGILERLVLFTSLIHGYPQMLIAFGAMKLGTRLHEEKGSEISNTYFLVGNLISIWLAMIGSIITNAIW
jgi:hypothetical protein